MDPLFGPHRIWFWGMAIFLVASAISGHIYAAEGQPDFYLIMKHCETSAGYLTSPDAPIKRLQPAPIHFECFRPSNKSVKCSLKFSEGDARLKGAEVKFDVIFDVPPSLLLANKHFADFAAIDSVNHSAVVVTRILEDEYLASKVCHGDFITAFEMEGILELENALRP